MFWNEFFNAILTNILFFSSQSHYWQISFFQTLAHCQIGAEIISPMHTKSLHSHPHTMVLWKAWMSSSQASIIPLNPSHGIFIPPLRILLISTFWQAADMIGTSRSDLWCPWVSSLRVDSPPRLLPVASSDRLQFLSTSYWDPQNIDPNWSNPHQTINCH